MDLIDRQTAINALAKSMPSLTTPDGCGEFDHDIQVTDEAYVDCMQIIHELPSAQSEIIHCCHCKWLQCNMSPDGQLPKGVDEYECRYWCISCDPTDYCSRGEREKDETS